MTGTRMLAEIREQPEMLRELCRRALAEWQPPKASLRGVSQAVVVGSGSSFNAGLAARMYLETVAGIATRVDHASESFRHKVPGRPLAIGLSHSGASSDVLAALGRAKRQGCRTLGVTNIEGSPLTRDADSALVTGAGVEHAIPSTKGFTALVAASLLIASLPSGELSKAARVIRRAAAAMEELEPQDELAATVASAKSVVFLGEGSLYPIARDAALKLLEVSYIPAFAYPPEEFRHGPIAMAEPGVVVVALAGVAASVTDASRAAGACLVEMSTKVTAPRLVRGLVRAAELQRLVHDVGVTLGRDVDNPRGLSKVVRARK